MSTQAKGTRLPAVLTPPQQKMHLGLPVDLRLRRSSRRASKRAIGSASAELAAVSISAACRHTDVSALCNGSHDAGLCACWADGRRGSPWRAVRRADSRPAVPVHAAGDLPVGSEDTGAITCHRRPATRVRARARQGTGRSARTASRAAHAQYNTCTQPKGKQAQPPALMVPRAPTRATRYWRVWREAGVAMMVIWKKKSHHTPRSASVHALYA